MGGFFRVSSRLLTLSGRVLGSLGSHFYRVSSVARCGRLGILGTFVRGKIDRTGVTNSAKCNCSSHNHRVLRHIVTSYVNTRSTLVHRGFISNARALAITLFNVLEPGSGILILANEPCSAVANIFNVSRGASNSLTSFKIRCRRITLGPSNAPSVRGVGHRLGTGGFGVTCVRHSHNCSAEPDLIVSSVVELYSAMGRISPRAIVVISGYCNRFIRGCRPYSIKTSLITNSLVGGTNNNVTEANNCVTNERSLIRGYTTELAYTNINHRMNTALNVDHRLCLKLFRTPRIINRTIGATICASTLFGTVKCTISPRPFSGHNSVIRYVALNSSRKLMTFYRNVRDNTPISTFIIPRP